MGQNKKEEEVEQNVFQSVWAIRRMYSSSEALFACTGNTKWILIYKIYTSYSIDALLFFGRIQFKTHAHANRKSERARARRKQTHNAISILCWWWKQFRWGSIIKLEWNFHIKYDKHWKRAMEKSQVYFLINSCKIENISCFLDTYTCGGGERRWKKHTIIDALHTSLAFQFP